MQKLFKLYFILPACLVLLIFGIKNVDGATPTVHISPRPTWLSTFKPYDKKPSARSIEGGYYYELIEEQEQVEKQADYNHVIKEIVSETGIQNASQIKVGFDPSFERLDFHDITIWRNGKPLNRLSTAAFKVIADEQDLSNFIYQGSFSALCILDDIRKGDRIEYSYTITGRNPIFDGKYCDSFYFQWGYAIEHYYTAIITSSQRKLNIKAFNKVSQPTISEGNGLKRYEYEGFQIPAADDTDDEPAWYTERGHIQVSEFDNWGQVVTWALGINPPSLNIKGELADQIAQLKKDAGDDKAKYFRNAVKTVQDEVRYMGIEIGQYSHRANNPEKVFKQRYGDCKDKSLLLVSMLKADGIEAYMVLVNADIGAHIDNYIPTYYAFNHAVVTAFINGKQVWVDATMDYQGGEGADIYFPHYGRGLILKAGNTALTTIAPPKTGTIVGEDLYTITNAKSPVLFTVKTTYTLNEADDIRGRLASNGMAETEKNYLNYYSKIYSKIEKKDLITVIDDMKKNELTTIESYWVSDFFKKDSTTNKLRADLFANPIYNQLPSITGSAKKPVAVTYPFDCEYTIKVILPGGWDSSDYNKTINRDYYRFASHYTSSGDTLSLNYKFAYLQDYVPVNKLAEFKDDIKKLNDSELGYNFTYTPPGTVAPSTINNTMVLFTLLLTVALIAVAAWIYQRETPGIVFAYGSTFVPVGGWLIVIAVLLGLMIIGPLIQIADGTYFELSAWSSHSGKMDLPFKISLMYECASNIIIICFSMFCLILLLNKRDILPRIIIVFFVLRTVLLLIDLFLGYRFKNGQVSDNTIYATIAAFIMAGICIPYFLRSSRVHDTFIVPYPPYNYSYEGPDGDSK